MDKIFSAGKDFLESQMQNQGQGACDCRGASFQRDSSRPLHGRTGELSYDLIGFADAQLDQDNTTSNSSRTCLRVTVRTCAISQPTRRKTNADPRASPPLPRRVPWRQLPRRRGLRPRRRRAQDGPARGRQPRRLLGQQRALLLGAERHRPAQGPDCQRGH